jgi:hypothetical protein
MESLVSDIPAGDGNRKPFLQCKAIFCARTSDDPKTTVVKNKCLPIQLRKSVKIINYVDFNRTVLY